MRDQKGFILLIGLLLGAVILVFMFSSFSGLLGKRVEQVPSIGGPGQTGEQIWGGQAVVYEIKDSRTGQVKTGSLGLIPYVAFGHRLSLQDSDYESYVEVLVENITEGVYETVRLGKGESVRVGGITITITNFINSSCPPGVQC